ncbi:hypothetical protein M3210_02875 [Oceanobacillus luteolus]|uniref:hypothetical protein n=1 Tax=Oceanobacillus luteolus TaxID=1274358 RepID=UPI002041F9C2|nr:hypothetical protein [Oceanobacillus luteolus]MCM3739206.1 hypothetical protein [Oceanobacillus luteolus]
MITTYPTLLKKTRARDNVIILDDLEFVFPKEQLEAITNAFNEGLEVEEIAKLHKRHQDEVFLALFHQARGGKVKRRTYRKSTLLVPGKVQLERERRKKCN